MDGHQHQEFAPYVEQYQSWKKERCLTIPVKVFSLVIFCWSVVGGKVCSLNPTRSYVRQFRK